MYAENQGIGARAKQDEGGHAVCREASCRSGGGEQSKALTSGRTTYASPGEGYPRSLDFKDQLAPK